MSQFYGYGQEQTSQNQCADAKEDNMSNQDPSFADPERQGPEQPEGNVDPREQQAYTPREFNADPREQPQWQAAPPPQQGGYMEQGYDGPGPQQMGPGQYGQPWQPYPQKRRQRGPLFWIASCLVVFLILLVLLGGILALIGLAIGKYGSYSKTEKPQTFVVGAHPTLVVNDDVGTIHVNAGGNSVIVQATEHNNGFWRNRNPNDAQVNYSQNGDMVTVNASVKANLGFFSTDSVDLNITVPSTADLQIKTNTGLIDVSGVSGQMLLSTSTGAIDATNDTLSSSSSLKSNTGEVSFNGSIDTNGGTYLFQADTGEVNVTLPAASSFHLIASTDTGSINSDFPVNIQHPNVTGASVNSDVGSSPKAMVTLKVNTGAINLHRG